MTLIGKNGMVSRGELNTDVAQRNVIRFSQVHEVQGPICGNIPVLTWRSLLFH